jgi:hypothetical protein
MVAVAHKRAHKDAYLLCEKIRRFVKHMLNREQAVRKLDKICKQLGLAELDLILDNSSKWEATPQMLDRIVHLETVIATYFREAGEQVPVDTVLLQKDFDFARELAGVLRPITNAIHLLEGDTFKGSVVLPVLWLLDKELMESEPVSLSSRSEKGKFVDVQHAVLSAAAQEFRQILRQEVPIVLKHLDQSRETLLMASALDPRWKKLPFATPEEVTAVKLRIRREAGKLKSSGPVAEAAQPRPKRLRSGSRPQSLPGMERMLSRAPPLEGPCSEALDYDEVVEQAVQQWFSSPSEHHDSDHLDWWARAVGSHGLGRTAAVLAPLARKYLAVPGANGSIERVWSVGRRVLASNRHCLAGARVFQLLRLKRNSELVGM